MRREELRGYLCVLAGTTLWGVSTVVAKSLFALGIPPAQLVLIRLALSVLVLFFVFLCFNRSRLVISTSEIPYFVILGWVGVAANQFTYYFTISKIHIALGLLIQYFGAIWVTLYAFRFQKEPISKWKILALFMALLGCYLAVGGYRIDLLRLNGVGILSGLACSLFGAFYVLYGEKGLKRHDPWTLIFYGFGFGAIGVGFFVSPVQIVTGGYSLKMWMAFFTIAIFQTLIPFGLYFSGIDRIRATRASITSAWEIIAGGLSAYVVLGEMLNPLQIMGGVAVIAAIILLQIEKERTAPSSSFSIRQKTDPPPLSSSRVPS
jgi:drug/metabolite transporter (DMT)-like permease